MRARNEAIANARGGPYKVGSARDLNRFLVINCLRENYRMSRVDIAAALGLSTATLTNVTAELMRAGYIQEVGTVESARGRRPILLELNRTAGYVLAVEMARLNHCTVGIFDLGCALVARREREVADLLPASLAGAVHLALLDLLAETQLPLESLKAVGVSSPGIVEAEIGVVVRAVNMGWQQVPLKSILEQELSLPVFVDNETNLSALGEYRYGQYRGQPNFIFIDVGKGVGSGLIVNGQLYHGAFGSAGEMGHLSIDADGPLCVCGARGCVEVLTSEPAILRWTCEQLAAGQVSRLQPAYRRGELQIQQVYAAFRDGDPVALAAMQRMASYLGLAILGLINLLSPDMVILGGDIWPVAGDLAQLIREITSRLALTEKAAKTPILPSSLGPDAPLIGAASLALEQVFSIPVFTVQN